MQQADRINFLTEFSSYLQDNNFIVSPDMLKKASKTVENASSDDEMMKYLRPVMCSARNEYKAFPELYKQFFKKRIQRKHDKDVKEQIKKELQESKSKQETIKKEREKLKKEWEDTLEKEKNTKRTDHKYQGINPKLFETRQELLEKAAGESMASKLKRGDVTKEEVIQCMENMRRYAENAIIQGELTEYKNSYTLFNALKRILSNIQKAEKEMEGRFDDINVAYQKKITDCDYRITYEEKNANTIQMRLNRVLEEESKTIIKEKAEIHRSIFTGGHNAVQAFDPHPEKTLCKDFNLLTQNQKQSIFQYIKENLLKFKTRITRAINTENRHDIDMLATIQSACRTGGLPMKIIYKEKKRSKARLMMVLDISGSCRKASEMMLSFMYLLHSVFPRDCRTYVFVNSLYDISGYMDKDNADMTVGSVLSNIPTRGVYSNYAVPICDLWENHKQEITRDSTIIFMGDARNNKNEPRYEELKNICRKAKNAYWLNTEEKELWDSKDSIASGYSRYAKMFETINTMEIINFIQNDLGK